MPTTPKLSPTDEAFGPVPPANQPGHHPEVEQDKPTGPPPGPRPTSAPTRFDFRFETLLRPFATLATVLPGTAHLEVDDEQVSIRFGLWRMAFPLAEVAGVEATGEFWFPKVAGPPHVSLADRGITFATNRQRGTCIRLRHPQPGPYPVLKHPAVTVTVDDPEALEAALRRA
jgi:hypothetical protein